MEERSERTFEDIKAFSKYTKNSFISSHTQEFLGFVFNTKSMQIQVPSKKIQKLKSRISQLQLSQSPKLCQWIAILLGKITSLVPAIGDTLLHI